MLTFRQFITDEVKRFWSLFPFATKTDLEKLKREIMSTEADIVKTLNDVTAQLVKSQGEISGIQSAADVLKQRVTDLEAVIAAGVPPSPELVAAVAAVKAQAQVVDDAIPDVTPTP